MADTIEGYAALYDTEAVIAGLFRERIARGAFRETIASDDIRSAFNHDLNQLLGRSRAGTVKFTEDARGLRYVITVNNQDPNALSVAAKIARRDVTGSSFWFAPMSDDDEQLERDDPKKLPLRTLLRVKLIEAAPVTLPAYPTTTASARTTPKKREAVAELDLLCLQIQIAKAWQ